MNLKKNLIDAQIVKQGHWKLRSKKHSDLYINKDDIVLDPAIYNTILTMFTSKIMFDFGDIDYDGITSPAVAGICFGSPVARQLGKPFIYPEKQHNPQVAESNCMVGFSFRSNFQKYIEGKKFIIIEDIVTTALSTIKTMEAIDVCGGEVVAVYCIWNRNPDNIIYIVKNNDGFSTVGKNSERNISGYFISVKGIIREKVGDWKKEECPLCKQNIPLLDPKTMEAVGV